MKKKQKSSSISKYLDFNVITEDVARFFVNILFKKGEKFSDL